MTRMLFKDAKDINVTEASDADLQAAWHSYASQISYHHADDSGKEWGAASALVPGIKALETEIKRRGLPRPTGSYLISNFERIDWEQAA